MTRHEHTAYTQFVRVLFSLTLLLVLVACGATPSTQATALPTSPRATPTPTFATNTTSLVTYTGHTDGVVSLQWSTDGKSIVSCSDDDTVQMWDVATGKQRWKYSPFLSNSYIFDVALSPDGKRVMAAGSKSLVWILDAITGHLLATFDDQSGFVLGVAWSRDSKRIAVADDSNIIQIKDAASGKTLLTYKGHTNSIGRIAWSPDGTRIASASYDGSVQIWNAMTGQHLLTYNDNKAPVFSVAWSPDGKRIVSGTGGAGHNQPVTTGNSVKVWDATTGQTLTNYTEESGEVYAVAWSPDGKYIASGGDEIAVHVWNVTTGHTQYLHKGHKDIIWRIAWSPDGKEIASASQDGTVLVWQNL